MDIETILNDFDGISGDLKEINRLIIEEISRIKDYIGINKRS